MTQNKLSLDDIARSTNIRSLWELKSRKMTINLIVIIIAVHTELQLTRLPNCIHGRFEMDFRFTQPWS